MEPNNTNDYRALSAILSANVTGETKAALFRKSLMLHQDLLSNTAQRKTRANQKVREAFDETVYQFSSILQPLNPSLTE